MTNSSTEDRESLENSPQSVTLVVDAPETPEVEDEDVLMAKDLEAMEQFDVGTLEFEADVFARYDNLKYCLCCPVTYMILS